jgi:hypothetical protein
MADSRKTKVSELDSSMEITDEDDDHSEVTVPSGRTTEPEEAELIEIFLRHEITIKHLDNHRGPHLRHAAVLKEMYSSFPEDDLQIINNRNKRIQLPNYQKWADEKYYQKHFDTYTITGKGGRPDRHFVVHRIRTTLSLSTIRNDRHVFQALQENDVFMKRHYFQEDEWNTVSLGFMLFFDPSKHPRDDAKERVINIALEEGCYGEGKGDRFQLVRGTPFLYVGGKRYPTQAYTVVCLREHASDVDDMLKKAYRKTSHYVKFRLRNKNAQAFGQALQAQNHYLSTLRTIPIVGLTNEMMQELEDKFLTVEGIGDIVRCDHTITIGRWNILTNEDNFHQVFKHIKKNLQSWLDDTFDESYERPEDFPDIRVTARVSDDDSSLGDCSYLSTSAISYGSFETTGSLDYTSNDSNSARNNRPFNDSTSTRSSRPTSYADATNTGSSHSYHQNRNTPRNFVAVNPSSVSAMSSPANVPQEVHQRMQEMEAKLLKFHDLEAKMDRLQQTIEALLHVNETKSDTTNNTVPSSQPTSAEQEEQGDPNPEEQYIPLPVRPAAVYPPTTTVAIPPPTTRAQGGNPLLAPPALRPIEPKQRRISSPHPPNDIQPYQSATTRSTATGIIPKQRSLGGAQKLWTDPNSAPDPIFDEWKLVENKKGKRTAETSNIGHSKRSDQRITPTKMQSKSRIRSAEPVRTKTTRHVGRTIKPHAIKKKLIFTNPYQNQKKQVVHPVVCANRPQTWQQRLNVNPSGEDNDNDETMVFSYPSPAPPSPQSPQRQFPAEEMQPDF